MKALLLAISAVLCIAGCSGGDETAAKPAEALNPSGKPRDQKEQALSDAHAKFGEQSNAEMAEAAKQIAAAKAGAQTH